MRLPAGCRNIIKANPTAATQAMIFVGMAKTPRVFDSKKYMKHAALCRPNFE